MSLSRAILRLATVQALRGATLAESRVFDSDMNPLDHRVLTERKPVAIVFTDDQQDEPGHHGDLGHGNGSVDLIIEIAIAGAVEVEGEDEMQVTVAETDAGMEFTLDLLERQVMSALTASSGQWPELWRLFCTRILRRTSKRGASSENGARFAARMIVLTCETLIEPPRGVTYPDSAWQVVIDAISASPTLAPVAPLLQAELAGQPISAWDAAARTLGVNPDELDAIGLGTAAGFGEDPVLLETIEVDSSLYLPPIVPAVPPDPSAEDVPFTFSLAALLSADQNNDLEIGSDGKLSVTSLAPGPGVAVVGDEIRLAISTLPQG